MRETKGRDSLPQSPPEGVVPGKALSLLDEENISYRRANDAEVPLKHSTIRTPIAPLL